MKGYKGFNSKLQCAPVGKVFQYEVGKTYTHDGPVSLCNQGFHFCEHPLDTWNYYAPLSDSRYAEVDADGVSAETRDDTKRVAKSLTVKAEVKIPALIKAAVEFVFSKVKSSPTVSVTAGDYAHSATAGNSAHSVTAGYSAHSATAGNYAHSVTAGDYAHSVTAGNYAHSATAGYSAHSVTAGYSAHSVTAGNYAHSATAGESAHSSVAGSQCIAASLGAAGQAKGIKGNWLVLSEWNDGKIKAMGIARVDGKKIKADTFYMLVDGKFVEAA